MGKYIMLSLDDEKAKKIASVIGNKTVNRILDFLSEVNEASETDIAEKLGMPINTVEYNLKKLLETGLIEKTKNFFWSSRGKKIDMYKIAKKHIVISPKSTKPSMSKLKSILPVAIICGIGAWFVKMYASNNFIQNEEMIYATQDFEGGVAVASSTVEKVAMDSAPRFIETVVTNPNVWIWFVWGALVAIVAFSLINWRKL